VAAPPKIIDAFESIIDIYFSGVRHRERASFILCDNLIESACKTRAKEINHSFNMNCNFHNACNAEGVNLPEDGLGSRVRGYRQTRNNMQHSDIGTTVDMHHCATVILDVVKVINHCWQNTSENEFATWMKCALRIIWLYSSDGDVNKRELFEEKMRQIHWRTNESERVRVHAVQIEPGHRNYWWFAIRRHSPLVEECLNEIEIFSIDLD